MINFQTATTNEQLQLVEKLAAIIWQEHYTPIIGIDQVRYMLHKFQSVASMAEQIQNGYQYFLINNENTNIGYLSFVYREDALFLSKIYVLKEDRGKGIGKKAMEFVIASARDHHCKKVSLTVNKNNINSISAYESIGFENKGALEQDIGGGFIMDDYQMEKLI